MQRPHTLPTINSSGRPRPKAGYSSGILRTAGSPSAPRSTSMCLSYRFHTPTPLHRPETNSEWTEAREKCLRTALGSRQSGPEHVLLAAVSIIPLLGSDPTCGFGGAGETRCGRFLRIDPTRWRTDGCLGEGFNPVKYGNQRLPGFHEGSDSKPSQFMRPQTREWLPHCDGSPAAQIYWPAL